jgi:tetratricopeptide (TPR) repeat protein
MERRLQRRATGDVMKLKLGAACFSLLLLAAAASLVAAQPINPEVASLNKIAGERLEAHDWDSAERHYLRALDIAANSEAGPTVAVLRQNLGNLYATESRYADAEKQYWLSYDLLKAQYGAQDLRVAPVLNKIAELTCLGGHFAAANSLFQRSLGILKSQKSPNDAEIATVLADLASTEWLLGNLSKAEKTLTGLTALFERGGKDQQANLAFVLEIRARIAGQEDNLPEAEAHCERALLILEQSGGPQDLATGLMTMGDLLLRRQDLQGAQAKLERALHLVTSDAAEESPLGAASMSSLARCYHMQGKPHEAAPLFERAIGIDRRMLAPDHPSLLSTMQTYARFLRETKRKKEAKKLEAYVHNHLDQTKRLNPASNVVDIRQLFNEQKH